MGGGDAEQGAEGGGPGAATVEAEDELVEIGLEVFAAQAVVDAQGPDLEVGEDPMDPGQDDMGGHRTDDMGIMGEARDAGIAGPSVLPWVHRIFSNLKVWALGVYHGLRRRHLQSYLDEFVFRFNRRRTRHAAFRSLLGIAAAHQPLSYKMLTSPEAKA